MKSELNDEHLIIYDHINNVACFPHAIIVEAIESLKGTQQ
jgi:hypothetical protein